MALFNIWELQSGATRKTFSAWGFGGLSRTTGSQVADTVSFTAPGREFDAEALLPYDGLIVIFRNNVRWFTGRITTVPRVGEPQAESISYSAEGPWRDLEDTIFQQTWVTSGGLGSGMKGRVVLGQGDDGSPINLATQITAILTYAAAQGCNIAAGTIEGSLTPPWAEFKDITCAEAIRRCVQWHPDHVVWVDYSTAVPTLNVRARANLAAVNLRIGGPGPVLSAVQITPREDLRVSGLIVRYERQSTVDGQTTTTIEDDLAGVTTPLRKVPIFTIPIGGANVTNTTMRIQSKFVKDDDSIANEPDTKSFWRTNVPALANYSDAQFDFITLPPYAPGTFFKRSQEDPNEVDKNGNPVEFLEGLNYQRITGNPTDWMPDSVKFQKQVLRARINDKVKNADFDVSFSFLATNSPTRTYSNREGNNGGETPTGIAASLFAAWNQLQYDGTLTLTERECSGLLAVGKVANLEDGRPEWATMRALLQTVTEHVDSGITTGEIGPTTQLSPADMISKMQLTKPGATGGQVAGGGASSNADSRATGEPGNGQVTQLGADKPNSNSNFVPVGGDGEHPWKPTMQEDPEALGSYQGKISPLSYVYKETDPSLVVAEIFDIDTWKTIVDGNYFFLQAEYDSSGALVENGLSIQVGTPTFSPGWEIEIVETEDDPPVFWQKYWRYLLVQVVSVDGKLQFKKIARSNLRLFSRYMVGGNPALYPIAL